MATSKTYREYFDINPQYYAAVTPELVEAGKVSWKDFYPHETFVDLLKKVNNVLDKKPNASIWVEGAYGTGKSHAVFTVKKMLEAENEEIEAYFADFGLNRDLCQKIITGKSAGKLLIVERTGSSDIHSDQDLIIKIQESVMAALRQQGIENQGEAALTGATLKWLKKPANKTYFGSLIAEEKYAWDFGGKSVDEIISLLQDGKDEEVSKMMRCIMKVAKDNNILAMQMDAPAMADWLTDIIVKNRLNAIIFIWDEFTEFFRNNSNSLTGFQTLVALCNVQPFYFMIVTHGSGQLIANADDAKKIKDRFQPVVKIELPDNIAFRLMKQAMKTTGDKVLKDKWERYAADLNAKLGDARKTIVDSLRKTGTEAKTQVKDEDFRGIVPMHPFSALLLKHISIVVGSNQRSMFEYIINDNPDAHGFKWFIENHGPLDNNNILTIDMLWNFFNLKGQNGQDVVNDAVRVILGNYGLYSMDKYSEDEQRVFKTILLLQAISGQLGNATELLRPNDRNLELAYSGTDWPDGKANNLAEQLCKDNLLFKQTVGKRTEYTVASSHGDAGAIEKTKKAILDGMKTGDMVVRARLMDGLPLPLKVKGRFHLEPVSLAEQISRKANAMASAPIPYGFHVAVTFALDEQESAKARREIENLVRNERYQGIFFLDATSMYLGLEQKEQYASDMAYSEYYLKQDKKQSDNYSGRAEESLSNWRACVESGSFILYSTEHPSGLRLANLQSLVEEFLRIEEKVYPYSLVKFNVIDNMFNRNSMGQGAGCGIGQKLEGTYRSANKQTSLDTALSGVWQVNDYWLDSAKQSLPIVKAKLRVEELIDEAFKDAGRISMKSIFEELQGGKFGYMPCNLTAFVLGFLLKEYADPRYFWSNGMNSKPMSVDVMKKMVADVLNPPKNYKEEFIVAMSPQQSSFLAGTAKIFHLPEEHCGSVEQARDRVRVSMNALAFPLWSLKHILAKRDLRCPQDTVSRVIDCYMGLANNANASGKSESDLAGEIGQLFLDEKELVADMEALAKNDLVREGMQQYIAEYHAGELLSLATDIGTGTSYLEDVKHKVNAGDANWVWNVETANDKIDDLILEYRIIQESNKSLPKTCSLPETVRAWNQKTANIRIACEALILDSGDLKSLLHILCKMNQQEVLPETEKKRFYDLLIAERENFENFYNGQFPFFYDATKSILQDMPREDAQELFDALSGGQFVRPRGEFFRYVESEAKKFVDSQAKTKLRNFWEEKTGTQNPYIWSRKYRTPILCMFEGAERDRVKKVFKAIIATSPSKEGLDAALAYLQQADFYDRLADANERDRLFQERVVRDYSVILKNPEMTRKYLQEKVTDEPYYWMDSDTVRRKIKDLAEKEYQLTGCDQALEIVDQLNERELQQYLRDLIGESLNVGIEILKHRGRG